MEGYTTCTMNVPTSKMRLFRAFAREIGCTVDRRRGKNSIKLERKPHTTEDYKDVVMSLCGSWNDDPRSTEEIKADIIGNRQSGVTRTILPL